MQNPAAENRIFLLQKIVCPNYMYRESNNNNNNNNNTGGLR